MNAECRMQIAEVMSDRRSEIAVTSGFCTLHSALCNPLSQAPVDLVDQRLALFVLRFVGPQLPQFVRAQGI